MGMHYSAQSVLPVFPVCIRFHMTRTTERNAIIGNGVILYIVNVVNMIAALVAHLAGVVITFADHAFEFIIECNRIGRERNTTAPCGGGGSAYQSIATFKRTKRTDITICPRSLFFIFLAANSTSQNNSIHSSFIKAFFGAINSPCATAGKKGFSAMTTNVLVITALPPGRAASLHFSRRMAGLGTIKGSIFAAIFNLKNIAAFFTNQFHSWLFGHNILALKGAPRMAIGLLSRQSGPIGARIKKLFPIYQTT